MKEMMDTLEHKELVGPIIGRRRSEQRQDAEPEDESEWQNDDAVDSYWHLCHREHAQTSPQAIRVSGADDGAPTSCMLVRSGRRVRQRTDLIVEDT
ncbi:MAG: hypothetical protein WCA45_07405 [Thiobacillaceae bacterium]